MNRICMGIVEHLMEPVCDLHYKEDCRALNIPAVLIGFVLFLLVML
ncbi:MAG TPA: hypothetical protein VN517_03855 [Terriglobales bacterium]|nr:hypothetical protein [Terriglobales bacterium]